MNNLKKFVKSFLNTTSFFGILMTYWARIHCGLSLFRGLLRQYGSGCEFLFNPQIGTGDAYLVGMCIPAFRARYPGQRLIALQYCGSGSAIIKNFSPDAVEELSLRDVLSMRRLCAFFGGNLPHLHVMHYTCSTHLEVLEWLQGAYEVSFYELFFKTVLGQFPSKSQYTEQKDSHKIVEQLFSRCGLVQGRTVLLSPYSNTIQTAQMGVWRSLAHDLHTQGFCVCTNLGTDEQAIPGTLGLALPITQVVPFLNLAGYFIGIRSGLCEVISEAICQKVILYPNMYLRTGCSLQVFYSTEQLGYAEQLTEYVFSPSEKISIDLDGDNGGNSEPKNIRQSKKRKAQDYFSRLEGLASTSEET